MKSNNSYLCALLVLVVTFIFNGASIANDSTSYVSSTGIEFAKNKDISIESESLNLAERSVSVEYEFYNHSSKEISVLMAFPLAEVGVPGPSDWMVEPEPWDFRVYVNGKKYDNVKLHWRAIANGVDKAQILQKLGISVGSPDIRLDSFKNEKGFNVSASCLNHSLKQEDQELLISEGLATKFSEIDDCLLPYWRAQATFLWEVKFAPKKITKVRHLYNQGPGVAYCEPPEIAKQYPHGCKDYSKEYPIVAEKLGEVPIYLHFYNYVLHTGGNWKGSIKKFNFKAQGPKGAWAWIEAPFPVKRVTGNILTAHLVNYKPLSKSEYLEVVEKQREQSLLRVEKGEIRFFYATKNKKDNRE